MINIFVDRALAGEPLHVYEPGTQTRNYVHVDDVARAYVASVEQLLADCADGRTGVTQFEVGSDEDPSVMRVAELVQSVAAEETGRDVEITRVENPRDNETLVETFTVETARTREHLGWAPTHTVEESIRRLVRRRAADGSAT